MLHVLHSPKNSDFSWGIMPAISIHFHLPGVKFAVFNTSMPCLSFCLRGGDGDDAATGAGPLGPWSGTQRDGHIKRVMFDPLKTNSFLYTQIVGLELLVFFVCFVVFLTLKSIKNSTYHPQTKGSKLLKSCSLSKLLQGSFSTSPEKSWINHLI